MSDADSNHNANSNESSPIADQSFLGNILTSGSSLDPTFLLLVDIAFFVMLLVLFALVYASGGNGHVLVLISIELGLWACVKWFTIELKKLEAGNSALAAGDALGSKPRKSD